MATQPQPSARLAFGPFDVDTSAGELRKSGVRVRLPGQPFQILLILLAHPGEVVSREQLRERIWSSGTFIDFEHGLSAAVNKLRRALGDSAENPRYIETVPGRGYRFIARVGQVDGFGAISDTGRSGHQAAVIQLQYGGKEPALRTVPEPLFRRRSRRLLWVGVTASLMTAVSFYVWLSNRSKLDFASAELAQLTTTGMVVGSGLSPDGKYVAYATGESKAMLRLRQIATGTDVEIIRSVPVNCCFRLTFSPDGTYIYYVTLGLAYTSDLMRIPVLGGQPRKIVHDIDSRAALSPDGSRIAFIRMNVGVGEDALVIANADGSEQQTIARRKGPERLVPAGAAWSFDGQSIAMPVSAGTHDYVAIENTNLQSERAVGAESWRYIDSLTWLPDNRQLIIAAESPRSTEPQIWNISASDGRATRLTNDLSGYRDVTVSADGKTVSATRTTETANLWIARNALFKAADPKLEDVHPITMGSGGVGIGGVAWVGNGHIAYTVRTDQGADLWVMDEDGRNAREVVHGQVVRGGFCAASDRYLVFTSHRLEQPDIWRVDVDGANAKLLAHGAEHPSCSPDGKWVAFISPGRGHRAFKIAIDGGTSAPLMSGYAYRQEFSPDGKSLMYQIENRIVIGPAEGGEPTRTLNLGPMLAARVTHWAANSDGFDYVKNDSGNWNLLRFSLRGARAAALTHFDSGTIWDFAWSPDGRKMAFSKGMESSDVVLIRDAKSK